jgi:hypothetical protein
MANYREVNGDATKPQLDNPTDIVVIPHICNNIRDGRVWGAGFTGALDKAFGDGPRTAYQTMAKESRLGLMNRLGEICVCNVNDENKIFVVNMIAQEGVRSGFNPRPIRYWSLMNCMQGVREFVGSLYGDSIAASPQINVVIHAPKFGSELAGGNWDFIKELIEEIWVDNSIDVVVYNYVP